MDGESLAVISEIMGTTVAAGGSMLVTLIKVSSDIHQDLDEEGGWKEVKSEAGSATWPASRSLCFLFS